MLILYQGRKGDTMKKTLLIVAALMAAATLRAEYSYDPKTGNTYNTYKNAMGGTTTQGFNSQTGKSWSTDSTSNGSMIGTDGNGNRWQYDKGSGNYYNYGTGETHNSKYGW